MIVLFLASLLNSLHHVAPYQYLPENIQGQAYYRANTGPHQLIANISEIPFHVLVVYSNLYCSGTLVRSKIVMTVASCLSPDRFRKLVVKLGVESVTEHGQIIPVIEIKIHEYYKYMGPIDNDIALLMLKENVVFNPDVKKAVLVEPEIVLRNGAMIEVSGWGFSNLPQAYVNQLLWTDMVVIDKAECAQHYKHLLTPSNFCAKYLPDHRLSDNGGPAVFDREVVVGMLSYGGTSTDEPHIAIFSNISYFSRWITLNTKRFLEKYCVVPKDDDPPEYYVLSETDD